MPGPKTFKEVITPSIFFTEIVANKNRNLGLQEDFVWDDATEILTFKSPRTNDANAAILDFRRHSFFVNGKGYAKFLMSEDRKKHEGDNDIALAHWVAAELDMPFSSAKTLLSLCNQSVMGMYTLLTKDQFDPKRNMVNVIKDVKTGKVFFEMKGDNVIANRDDLTKQLMGVLIKTRFEIDFENHCLRFEFAVIKAEHEVNFETAKEMLFGKKEFFAAIKIHIFGVNKAPVIVQDRTDRLLEKLLPDNPTAEQITDCARGIVQRNTFVYNNNTIFLRKNDQWKLKAVIQTAAAESALTENKSYTP